MEQVTIMKRNPFGHPIAAYKLETSESEGIVYFKAFDASKVSTYYKQPPALWGKVDETGMIYFKKPKQLKADNIFEKESFRTIDWPNQKQQAEALPEEMVNLFDKLCELSNYK